MSLMGKTVMNIVTNENSELLKSQLLPLWKKYTLEEPNSEVDFFESGGDSLAAINLIVDLRKLIHVEISYENFMRNPTIPFLIDCINSSKIGNIHE